MTRAEMIERLRRARVEVAAVVDALKLEAGAPVNCGECGHKHYPNWTARQAAVELAAIRTKLEKWMAQLTRKLDEKKAG